MAKKKKPNKIRSKSLQKILEEKPASQPKKVKKLYPIGSKIASTLSTLFACSVCNMVYPSAMDRDMCEKAHKEVAQTKCNHSWTYLFEEGISISFPSYVIRYCNKCTKAAQKDLTPNKANSVKNLLSIFIKNMCEDLFEN